MSCGSVEDNSGEILRSFLTPFSPTSVSDDTGDIDGVGATTIFSPRDPVFVSGTGGRSSFRRFGGEGSSDGGVDVVNTGLPYLHAALRAGWAAFKGAGTLPVA